MRSVSENRPLFSIRLADARAERDLSQAEVASRLGEISRAVDGMDVGASARTVRRWEHGVKPAARYRRLLYRLYDATPEQLGFRDVVQQTADPSAEAQRDHGTLEPLLGPAGWEPRTAEWPLEPFAHDDLAPVAAVQLVHEWLVLDPPQLVEPRAGRRIGEGLVGQVERRVEQLRYIDDFVGGRDLHDLVARELRATIDLLNTAACSDRLGRRLLVAVGELCQLAGWVASDAGLRTAAARYYVAGVRAAHAADDRPLAAHAISSLAYQLASNGDARAAVVLARSAYEGAKDRATATTQALLLERVAWAHARAGELAQTERALDAVDRAFERRHPAEDPLWVYWLDRDEIDVMAGRCYAELHRPASAAPLLQRVLERYGDERAREAALYTSWLADAHIETGDVDRAADAAIRALTLAARVNSDRSDERIAHLHRALTPHRAVAKAREFDERYRSVNADA